MLRLSLQVADRSSCALPFMFQQSPPDLKLPASRSTAKQGVNSRIMFRVLGQVVPFRILYHLYRVSIGRLVKLSGCSSHEIGLDDNRLCLKRGFTLWRRDDFLDISCLAEEGQTPFQTEPKSYAKKPATSRLPGLQAMVHSKAIGLVILTSGRHRWRCVGPI